MKLTETIYSILLNEYNDTLIQKLVDKFKAENPNLTDEIILKYIKDFKNLSSKLENKDINTYTWKQLETAVDSNKSVKIKAGKIDVNALDSNLLYKKDGIRLYHGKDKKACIRYSNGYSFCIGARGKDNMFGYYRHGEDKHSLSGTKIFNTGTPYFVFNDNLDKSNPEHVLVIFSFYYYTKNENDEPVDTNKFSFKDFYTVTNANNDGDETYKDLTSVIKDFPWIANIQQYIKPTHLTKDEKHYFDESKSILKQIDLTKMEINRYIDELPDDKKYSYFRLKHLIFNAYNGEDYSPEKNFETLLNGGIRYEFSVQAKEVPFYFVIENIPNNKLYKYVEDSCDYDYDVLATPPNIENVMKKEAKFVVRDLKKAFNEAYESNGENLPNDYDRNADKIFKIVLQEFKKSLQPEDDYNEEETTDYHMTKVGFTNNINGKRTFIEENNDFVQILKKIFPLYRELDLLKKKYKDIV